MRRAVPFPALAASILILLSPAPGHAQGSPERINGIGLIDFGVKPSFKVGDWAKYHMSARSALGVVDDYTVTVLIGGEEQWWGEDCFWIETWTQSPSGSQAVASLMSYDVFRDSLAMPHMQLYVRKIINGFNEKGLPDQIIYKRPVGTLKTREPVQSQFKVQVDTIGTESTTVPKGSFDCVKLHFLQGRGATGAKGDSTDYTELRESRTTFMNRRIPITHIVREDIEQTFTRKAWLVGHSKDATPTLTLDKTEGSAQLVEFGTGLEAQLVPKALRRSIAEQRAAEVKPAAPAKSSASKKKAG